MNDPVTRRVHLHASLVPTYNPVRSISRKEYTRICRRRGLSIAFDGRGGNEWDKIPQNLLLLGKDAWPLFGCSRSACVVLTLNLECHRRDLDK